MESTYERSRARAVANSVTVAGGGGPAPQEAMIASISLVTRVRCALYMRLRFELLLRDPQLQRKRAAQGPLAGLPPLRGVMGRNRECRCFTSYHKEDLDCAM